MLANSISVASLCKLIDAFQDAPILVYGDVILDEYIWGSVDRVSPEAPIVVVDVNKETLRLGGAANVAHNLSTLGACPTVVGVIGDDEGGVACTSLFEQLRIGTSGLLIDDTRPTTRKSRVVAHSQQIVRIDRESREPVSKAIEKQLHEALIEHSATYSGIIVSDYGKGVVTPNITQVMSVLRGSFASKPFSFPIIVDPKLIPAESYRGATCFKPNRKEAAHLSGEPIASRKDALRAAKILQDKGGFDEVMITLGADGLVLLYGDNQVFELDTIAQEVYDVSGAGDTVSAVYALTLMVGGSPIEAAILSNCAAARVIREVGTATLDVDELKAVVKFWEEHL